MGRFPSLHTVCSIAGCEQPHKSRGLCASHYTKWYRKGLLPPKTPKPTQCTLEGCNKVPLSKGLCSRHYREDVEYRRKNGTQPEPLRIIQPGHCPRCGKPADKRHLSRCRSQPKIQPGDGDPRHGTELGYVHHKCRCSLCRKASYEAGLARRRKRGEKERKSVGAHHVHAHIEYLNNYVSMGIIAKTLGRSTQGLYYTLNRPRVPQEFALKILSTTVSDVLDQVQPTSYLRKDQYVAMVQELLEAGWNKDSICKEIGYTPPLYILRPGSHRIQARFARRIQALHDEAWRNNINGFRLYCTCMQVSEPETLHATERQQRSRERRSA